MTNLWKNKREVTNFILTQQIKNLINLLRWNKPSGRLILLIPAGWSLWIAPSAPPNKELIVLIMLGGLFVSGAGCIANDLWDRKIDAQVKRTQKRPLANRSVNITTAVVLLIFLLVLSSQIIFWLPIASQGLCLKLALIALGPILLYPSSKRWFHFPQLVLAICWGFAVLIPWAASEASLNGGVPLVTCWLATVVWTFGFDTVYAMADKEDDKKLNLNSSAISLGSKAYSLVSICYLLTSILIAISAFSRGIGIIFWPIWLLASITMQKEVFSLKKSNQLSTKFGRHFLYQVFLGALILLGLILGTL